MMTGKKMAFIEPTKCKRHDDCPPEKECVAKAIKRDEDGFLYVETDCVGCAKCVKLCPERAITMI